MWAGWKHSGNLAPETSNVVCERPGAGGYRLTKETTYSSLNIDYIV